MDHLLFIHVGPQRFVKTVSAPNLTILTIRHPAMDGNEVQLILAMFGQLRFLSFKIHGSSWQSASLVTM